MYRPIPFFRDLHKEIFLSLTLCLALACGPMPPEQEQDQENSEEPRSEVAQLTQSLIGPPPQITSISPNMASAAVSVMLTLTGKNFRPGTTVTVSGVDLGTANVHSTTELSFYLPGKPGAFGRVPITVKDPSGKSATRSDLFYRYTDHMQVQAPNVLTLKFPIGTVNTADLNGDGKMDVLSVSLGQVVAYLSNGDGTLQDPKLTALGWNAVSLVVADFNGDGKRDVAVAQANAAKVSILLGNGDGTFKAPSDLAVANQASVLTVGDVNGDGKADLLATYSGLYDFTGGTVLLGKGDGSFTSLPMGALGSTGEMTAIADFNRDGKADFLLFPYGNDVKVSLGKGDGTFDTVATKRSTAPSSASAMVVADLNGDGMVDLAVAKSTGGVVGLMLGKGDGTFAASVDVGPTAVGLWLGLAEVTGDGKLDLVVGTSGPTHYVLPGNGDGSYGAALSFQTAFLRRFQLADLDGDGKLDLLSTPLYYEGVLGGLLVLYGNGSGSFADTEFLPGGTVQSAIKVADVNADGKMDVLAASYDTGTVGALLGSSLYRFAPAKRATAGKGPTAIEVGDINGDGKKDLVISNYDSSNVSVLFGNGDGTYGTAVNYPCGSGPSGVVVVDFNGDGKLDVATSNFDADSVSVFLNTGLGGLAVAKSYPVQKAPAAIATGDVDGDGKADLVTSSSDSSTVSVLLATATSFASAKNYAVGKTPAGITIADLNGDGKADLAVANTDGNSVSVLLNSGAGKFAPAIAYNSCPYPTSVLARDLDHDNRVDLAVSCDGASPRVNLLMGFGDGVFFPSQLWVRKPGAGPVAMEDLDGDGKADFIMASEGSGLISLFLNRSP